MVKIKYIIFDLDGVLVDATEWHYEALNRALRLFGYEISKYDHVAAYNGLPSRKKLEMLSIEKGLPHGLHALINRVKQVHTQDEIATNCRPTFDKEYMIMRLRKEGLKLAVCSNAIQETVELMLEKSGIIDAFEFVLSNEDVSKPKPDPEIYRIALDRFGCQPGDALIVEDAPHGIEAATRSGAHLCAVTGFADVTYERVREAIGRVEQR